MALPAIPIVLGITGLAALVLPKLKEQPRALTKPEEIKEVYIPKPGETLQGIPQVDPSKPALVRTKRGTEYMIVLRSVTPWDGITPIGDYASKENEKMEKFFQSHSINWDAETMLVPLANMRPGDPYQVKAYFLDTVYDGHLFKAPQESGFFVVDVKLDPGTKT